MEIGLAAREAVGRNQGSLVKLANYEGGSIWVKCQTASIAVLRGNQPQIEIMPSWNETKLTCDLLIDGEPCAVWLISQKILGDFFCS